MAKKESAEKAVRDIRRKTRRRFSAEEKIRIVIEGLRGEESIASLCRREGIVANLYYRWSKEFLEAAKALKALQKQKEETRFAEYLVVSRLDICVHSACAFSPKKR